ncbi:hypothetical protein DCAR_0625332 [Daucus carota subsp. sativus]|uniref:Uncharacterized protein n=2 Tax=Daucus carota subsp. sativus TaxID=79200 RepID=A0AAF0XF78_DAUCS|nr:hypothetical protein DCAR_0625332 [Daucus carota subsp. sativus]
MSWKWKEADLDRVLVPIGLFLIIAYHAFFIYRYRKFPLTTVLGRDNYYRKIWTEKCLQLNAQDRGTSVSVIGSNISDASALSSVSLVLSSLIGAWIGSSKEEDIFVSSIIYGDTSTRIVSVKYVALLSFFLVAFAAFMQTTRNYALATFLITIPSCDIPVNYVQKPILRASHCYTVGMRSLYTAGTLILWIFGPIPMFVSSVSLVAVLYYLDRNLTPPHQFQPLNLTPLYKTGEELASSANRVPHHQE